MASVDRAEPAGGLYLPALDGLRFLAFALVFIHHSSPVPLFRGMYVLRQYGWVGVELFFVISAFLFFHLLRAEQEKTGQISISKFYGRRFLRLYPLMIGWPLLVSVLHGVNDPEWLGRMLGLATFTDNFIAWKDGLNFAVPFTPHLWTLSFEFQIYLVIPLAFVLATQVGDKRFAMVLGIVWLFCFGARAAVIFSNIGHPAIWVTPFLRPETVLIGVLLSLPFIGRIPGWVYIFPAIIGGALLVIGPVPEETSVRTLYLYPVVALFCGGMVGLTVRTRILASVFGWAPLRFLGKISFGLYVFHWYGLHWANTIMAQLGHQNSTDVLLYTQRIAIAFGITLACSVVSYYAFERWFLLLKDKLSLVKSRPI